MTARSPGLAALDVFVGEWSMLARFQQLPPAEGDDGRGITRSWEICHDGTTWEHDFKLSFRRRS